MLAARLISLQSCSYRRRLAGAGDFISAAIKGAAGIGEIAAAFAATPASGGMALGGAAALAAAGVAA